MTGPCTSSSLKWKPSSGRGCLSDPSYSSSFVLWLAGAGYEGWLQVQGSQVWASQPIRKDWLPNRFECPQLCRFLLTWQDEHDQMCTFAQADRMQRLWLCGPEGRKGTVLAKTAGLCREHWWCVLMLLPTWKQPVNKPELSSPASLLERGSSFVPDYLGECRQSVIPFCY